MLKIMNKNQKAKIITNGDDSIKTEVRDELIKVLSEDEVLRERVKYLISSHQEKLVPTGLTVNKKA